MQKQMNPQQFFRKLFSSQKQYLLKGMQEQVVTKC